jgi:hypothetical protein
MRVSEGQAARRRSRRKRHGPAPDPTCVLMPPAIDPIPLWNGAGGIAARLPETPSSPCVAAPEANRHFAELAALRSLLTTVR